MIFCAVRDPTMRELDCAGKDSGTMFFKFGSWQRVSGVYMDFGTSLRSSLVSG